MKARAVGLDFFGTLVEIDQDVQTVDQFLTSIGYPCPAWLARLYTPDRFDGFRTHRGNVSQTEYVRWRRRLLVGLLQSRGVPGHRIALIVDEILRIDQCWTVRARSGANEFITWLLRAKVPVGVCSNWDYDLRPYVSQAQLIIPGDLLITSAHVGARKPHARPFKLLARALGCRPHEIVFVGDSFACDVTGAIHSGMRAIWLTNTVEAGRYSKHVKVCESLGAVLEELKKEFRGD